MSVDQNSHLLVVTAKGRRDLI